MASLHLDTGLLKKIAQEVRKPEKYVREQISKRATRFGIASPAAQILWARELGIGTAVALRKLPPHVQDQVQSALPTTFAPNASERTSERKPKARSNRRPIDPISLAVDYLLTDAELKSRCTDLLKKRQHLDRAFREATTVLENRIKRLANMKGRNPEQLVNIALNPDPAKAVLVVSSEPSEQTGFHSICKGIVLTFRHRAHHELDDNATREDALRFCAFVDVVLGILAKAKVRSNP
jgi:hypothetical protein